MASTYRGYRLQEAFATQIAVYFQGSFKGHFPTFDAARSFIDAQPVKETSNDG